MSSSILDTRTEFMKNAQIAVLQSEISDAAFASLINAFMVETNKQPWDTARLLETSTDTVRRWGRGVSPPDQEQRELILHTLIGSASAVRDSQPG